MFEKLLHAFRVYQVKVLRVLYKSNTPSEFYLLFLAVLIGTLTGFGAYLLNIIVDAVHFTLFKQAGLNIIPAEISDYLRILFPALGGLAVGLLTFHFSPEVKGHGIPGVMEAVANRGGYIRKRVSILTSINSGMTIGSGGSAGKEGPIVQIGAAIGSSIGQIFHVSQERLKILVGCGTAAGLAAVFNAPIAGVVFTIEIILADYSLKAFTPIVISAVIGTAISHEFINSSPIFHIPSYSLNSHWELPLYLLMGILGGILSVGFIRTLYKFEDYFEDNLKLPVYLKPALGGLLVGVVAYWFPELYGFDDSAIHNTLLEQPGILILAVLIIAKMISTSLTLGSGGTGGLFTPSLFIGAMFGALYGTVVNSFYPDLAVNPGAYALVGMAVMVAGTIHAPLSAFLIIFEVTGDYAIILPLMLGTVAATLVARWLENESIYTMKISSFSGRIEQGRNLDILQNIEVHSLMQDEADTFSTQSGFEEILDIFMKSRYSTFPVIDKNNHLRGIVTLRDLRPILRERDLGPLLLAMDIMSENIFVLKGEDTIDKALQMMDIDDFELLPVVDSEENMHYLGTVSKDQILKLYAKKDLIQTETGK